MRFLADECCDAALVHALRGDGHDVLYAVESLRGATDDELLTRAFTEGRILLTEDKDFGELVYRFQRRAHGIVLLRFDVADRALKIPRLRYWLEREARPDVVCLSNALLVGLARRIKERLRVPVVCLLQDEDGFLDGLGEFYSLEAWRILRERLADVDALVAVSDYYAGVMGKRLNLAVERVQVVHGGVEVERYQPAESPPEAPTIGFLSRMCEEKGLE